MVTCDGQWSLAWSACSAASVLQATHRQDGCAEMLAAVRRGPGSPPTNDEMIEYLIARKRHDQERPPAENYSFEHVCGWEESVD